MYSKHGKGETGEGHNDLLYVSVRYGVGLLNPAMDLGVEAAVEDAESGEGSLIDIML